MSVRSTDLSELARPRGYPLLQEPAASTAFAWRGNHSVSRSAFLDDVRVLGAHLTGAGHLVNLCEDRYLFLTAFASGLVGGCVTLLPSSRARHAVDEMLRHYPGAQILRDQDVDDALVRNREAHAGSPGPAAAMPWIPSEQLAAIVFTSGSTGRARPNLKFWGDLVTGARMMQERFAFGMAATGQSLVATVPPQHMYGLETSILNPLINGVSVYTGSTFFPADIAAALGAVPAPRVLVTTPVHMQACLAAQMRWPELQAVISATAPLSTQLAARAEESFGCPVLEIYGCTEAGSVASRRTLAGDAWLLFGGLDFKAGAGGYNLCGPHLREEVPLHDMLEPLDQRRFVLLGRHADMVNIAGKRASLTDLNIRLQEIDGVDDGAFFIPDGAEDGTSRLIAFVVSKTLDAGAVRQALASRIDPVFVPRPLFMVDRLPRNETGKLPRAALKALLQGLRQPA